MRFFCWQKYFTRAVLLVIVGAPLISFAAGGMGFIDRNIWFNTETFFAGETVRVYTALLNTGTKDAYGTIEFFINSESIGTADFVVQRGGNVVTVWKDFVAPYGEITVGVRAIKIILTAPGIPDEEIFLDDVGATLPYFVDRDSDGDGIGDRDDPVDDRPDSDGDGIPDAEDSDGGQSRPALGQFIDMAQSVEQKIDAKLRSLAEKLRALKEKSGRDDSGDSGIEYDRDANVDTVGLDTDSLPREQLLDIRMSLEGGQASVQESGVMRFFRYLYSGILTALAFILENRFFRYGTIIALLYLMLIRRRR